MTAPQPLRITLGDLLDRANRYALANDIPNAITAYEAALEPSKVPVGTILHNLMILYMRTRRFVEARAAAHAQVMFIKCADSFFDLAAVLDKFANIDGAVEAIDRGVELEPMHNAAQSFRLFLLARSAPLQYAYEEHKRVGQMLLPTVALRPAISYARPNRPRIGYVSGDFRQHTMHRIIEPLLRYHNLDRFDIYCYDTINVPDATGSGMRHIPGLQWRNVATLEDDEASRVIRQDNIDILVDLSGYTFGHRLRLFTNWLAPVQLTWCGYQHTTGLQCFTGRITDDQIDPVGVEELYTEPLIYLPAQYAVDFPLEPTVSPLPFDRNERITFGMVNSFCKVTPALIGDWTLILTEVPDSRLVLIREGCSDEQTGLETLRMFPEYVRDRIVLTERTDPVGFEKILAEIDIALDTFPYGGGVTSLHCLWHGVPVVGRIGDRGFNRTTPAVLQTLGMLDCVAHNRVEYVGAAVRMAGDIDGLRRLRQDLRPRCSDSPYFQPDKWVREVEMLYDSFWPEVF